MKKITKKLQTATKSGREIKMENKLVSAVWAMIPTQFVIIADIVQQKTT